MCKEITIPHDRREATASDALVKLSGMRETSWSGFIERFPTAHLIAGILPEKEGGGAKLRHRLELLTRLMSRLALKGSYALVINREGSRPEIHCAFEWEVDARLVAQALLAGVISRHPGWASQRAFALDARATRAIKTVL